MKPAAFTYHAPASLEDAVTILAEVAPDEGRVLAGGQSLVPAMALRAAMPRHLVDINRIAELSAIESGDAHLEIGACVRHVAFERALRATPLAELLGEVVRHIAHYPIRTRGTFCGSIAHADPAAEWCLVAATLGATMCATSVRGTRTIPAQGFFQGVMTTALAADELLVSVQLPQLAADTRFGFYEFSRRAGDFAMVMALASYRIEDGVAVDVCIGVGRDRRSPAAARRRRRGAPRSIARCGCVRSGRRRRGAQHRSAGERCRFGRIPARALRSGRHTCPSSELRSCMNERVEVTLDVNGRLHVVRVEPRRTLADVLRDDCGLGGVHTGCEHGVCGTCTIVVDGEPVRACLMFAVQAQGSRIMTVEGLADGDKLHPLQRAFIEHHAVQCGYCTPGFLMLAWSVLSRETEPSDAELLELLSSNLCRCTGYRNIVQAVRIAAAEMRAG